MARTAGEGEGTPVAGTGVSSDAAEDRVLVERAVKGEREAYRALVEKYQSRAFALAVQIVRSREDAEDIVQEAFVKMYLALGDFRRESSFYTWLYRIVFNMAVDLKRRRTRREKYEDPLQAGAPADTLERNGGSALAPADYDDPQQSLLRKEELAKVQSSIDEMSDEHRAVILLREVDGLSYDEISRIAGVAKGTVMSRLHYARRKIQEALRELRDGGQEERAERKKVERWNEEQELAAK